VLSLKGPSQSTCLPRIERVVHTCAVEDQPEDHVDGKVGGERTSSPPSPITFSPHTTTTTTPRHHHFGGLLVVVGCWWWWLNPPDDVFVGCHIGCVLATLGVVALRVGLLTRVGSSYYLRRGWAEGVDRS
jgi:hypothetical protein